MFATEQHEIEIDGNHYTITAMPASVGLAFLDKYRDVLDNGKSDAALMRDVITMWVTHDNVKIDQKKFDILFSRKYVHMRAVYGEVIKFNFEELFQKSDSGE